MAAYVGDEDATKVSPVEALSLVLMQTTEFYLSQFESRRSEKATKELGVTVRHFASCLSERPDRFDEFATSDDETERLLTGYINGSP
ncbi:MULTISPECIES: hypothetical protein [Methylomonas]|uniref:Uncharacterized protein n=2 Tax=Methylomonas TaxID=416 RepID=A0A126T493_9GAMM|nr:MULTISPECIES: hypothetical protein [Methylomonas]AMK76887.1 hypothetical protein JT25_010370 [Methylomonas denitrificans]OAI09145.1 hypothetical protein A1342_19810 [Methylomonas methanica]TCV74192.1 hypothetical protein EDE11_1396 [Methylomonas methanica]